MKTIKKTLTVLTLMMLTAVTPVGAQSLGDLLGGLGKGNGTGGGNAITNILEGVFSSSNLTLKDLAGKWTTNGPAVTFQAENFLKKAGGIAAAGTIESKLAPYYKQYGLNGAVFEIESNGAFKMVLKGLNLSGTISETGEKGVFEFNFKVLGSLPIGSMKTFIQKTSGTMDIMFDATKFKSLVSAIAKFTGNSLAKTAASILDSYDGMCVGFRTELTGNTNSNSTNNPFGTSTGSQSNKTNGTDKNKNNNDTDNKNKGSGLDQLINILGGKK